MCHHRVGSDPTQDPVLLEEQGALIWHLLWIMVELQLVLPIPAYCSYFGFVIKQALLSFEQLCDFPSKINQGREEGKTNCWNYSETEHRRSGRSADKEQIWGRNSYRIPESLRLEKPSKIMEPNC